MRGDAGRVAVKVHVSAPHAHHSREVEQRSKDHALKHPGAAVDPDARVEVVLPHKLLGVWREFVYEGPRSVREGGREGGQTRGRERWREAPRHGRRERAREGASERASGRVSE